jgi:ABC-type dipeptide/oligopeptide/nickel transport system permease component
MAAFVLRRLLWTIAVLFVAVTAIFFLMRSIGGDPFRHGPLVGLSNVAWVKYGDYQPPGNSAEPAARVRPRPAVVSPVRELAARRGQAGLRALALLLGQRYVLALEAKGLRRPPVVGLQVLRNSLIPVVSAAAPLLGYLLTGSFVIETIFSVPGIGRFFVASVLARDYTVVMGITVLLAAVMILVNMLADILYAVLDPRLRTAPG